MANLNTFSMSSGINLPSNGPVVSKHGFEFASINHGLSCVSSIKSNPNNYTISQSITSKANSLLLVFTLACTASTISLAIPFISSHALANLTLGPFYFDFSSKYCWNSSKLILFAFSNFPYSFPFFWMASLVRWMSLLSTSSRENS